MELNNQMPDLPPGTPTRKMAPINLMAIQPPLDDDQKIPTLTKPALPAPPVPNPVREPMPEPPMPDAPPPSQAHGALDAMALGMAYVPMQKWSKLYDPDTALYRGTLFPDLDKPFLGKEGLL